MARKRVRVKSDTGASRGGRFFAAPSKVPCFSSGAVILDCVLGGGWAENRVINIVGDKSTGKTLLAIEACANFAKKYPHATIHYNEVEAAFDLAYAEAIGLPLDRVHMVGTDEDDEDDVHCFTVQDVERDLTRRIDAGEHCLYIIDSLDALSDTVELATDTDKGTYGAQKAKKLSEMFRKLNQRLAESKVTLMVISQVRDKIGVSFGRKTSRSGGRALDFYCSQVIYLAHIGRLKKVIKKVTRVVGVKVKATCDKNKVTLPFRECEFPIFFGFGVDDATAGLNFLLEVGASPWTVDESKQILKDMPGMTSEDWATHRAKINEAVVAEWYAIEDGFLNQRKKY